MLWPQMIGILKAQLRHYRFSALIFLSYLPLIEIVIKWSFSDQIVKDINIPVETSNEN